MALYILIKLEDKPGTDIIGVKEDLAMHCEKYGDIKLINVTSTGGTIQEQIKLGNAEGSSREE